MIVDGKAQRWQRGWRYDREGNPEGMQQGREGAGGSRRQPRRIGTGFRTHPPGAARRKARKIPIVVSMGSVAASGGYWVSTPADFIYAEPSTITGSIGVFGVIPSFQGTLQKLGVGADGVKTTPLSGEPDLFKGRRLRRTSLSRPASKSMYHRFLTIVAEVAPQDAAAGRPDRPRPRLGRRNRAPDRSCRQLRRNAGRHRKGRAARWSR